MNGGFGDDIGVQAVAEVDGVDVVTVEKSQSANLSSLHLHQVVIPESRSMFTMAAHWNAQSHRWYCARRRSEVAGHCKDSPFQIAVHDREEDLQEQVDGVDQHRQQIEPRFTRHGG